MRSMISAPNSASANAGTAARRIPCALGSRKNVNIVGRKYYKQDKIENTHFFHRINIDSGIESEYNK